MSARIFLFPAARRVGFLRRQLAGVAHHNRPETKAKAFDAVLEGQFRALSRIAGPEAADAHCAELARLLVAHIRPKKNDDGNGAGGAGGAA
ncbi:MAG: hypothetical protein INF18_04995 [Methylobacterium sp.]|nr:hypothetical protein [Methylobacterium sp.]MCA3637805.1 hypothetical protein [Methylobacterium sp.]